MEVNQFIYRFISVNNNENMNHIFLKMFRILLLLLNFGNDKKYMYITIYGIIVLNL